MCVLNLSIFCDTLNPGLELPAQRLPKSAAKNSYYSLSIDCIPEFMVLRALHTLSH